MIAVLSYIACIKKHTDYVLLYDNTTIFSDPYITDAFIKYVREVFFWMAFARFFSSTNNMEEQFKQI